MDEAGQLREELQKVTEEVKHLRSELSSRVDTIEKDLKNHGHEGYENDGTKRLERTVDLLAGQSFGVGNVSTFGGLDQNGSGVNRTLAIMASGRDQNEKDGSNNAQVYLEHQLHTDGTTNQTFFQGLRAPVYTEGICTVASGGTTIKQNSFRFEEDALVGAFAVVLNSAGTSFNCYEISANTTTEITITGGTWGFGGTGLTFNVFVPVYLGSATFPWRRTYTMDGTAGGLRFGPGPTAGGQNGLLYMDAVQNGGLAWRNKSGTTAYIYVGSGAPGFSAAKGSLYIRTDGSSTSTRMYINTDGSTTWTNFTTAA